MINFRKLKQDFSSNIVKEGKELYDSQRVVSAKLLHLDNKTMRVSGRVQGQYENYYESEIEIDRQECETIDSDCDCPHNYDCHHIAALIFYIEENMNRILVDYSKENDMDEMAEKQDLDHEERQKLFEKLKEAETKESARQEEQYQKQLLQEYVAASSILGVSPFFRPRERRDIDRAEAALIFMLPNGREGEMKGFVEIQLALRLPQRSKPLHVAHIKDFLEALRYEEPIFMGGRRYCFSLGSFDASQRDVMKILIEQTRFPETVNSEKAQRVGLVDAEVFGSILAKVYEMAADHTPASSFTPGEEELPILPGVYEQNLESPVRFSPLGAGIRFLLEYRQKRDLAPNHAFRGSPSCSGTRGRGLARP